MTSEVFPATDAIAFKALAHDITPHASPVCVDCGLQAGVYWHSVPYCANCARSRMASKKKAEKKAESLARIQRTLKKEQVIR